VRKRRQAKGLLTKAEEDLRLLRRQLKSQPALPGRQINHPQEPPPEPGGWATSRQGLDMRASPSSTLTEETTTASDVNIQLLQLLRPNLLVGEWPRNGAWTRVLQAVGKYGFQQRGEFW
jgi:hypothetical protein